MSAAEVVRLSSAAWPELDAATLERVGRFYDLLVDENSRQNLTRLISPGEFVQGHLIDVRELVKTRWIEGRTLDMGSGAGVPGLLCALIDGKVWTLSDSEVRKAEFLERVKQDLNLKSVNVTSQRAEEWLRSESVDSITSRAVGKIEKLYGWLEQCSTWNSIILFKGPGWREEWAEFGRSKHRIKLSITAQHDYTTDEGKIRKLIRLVRVPRGTDEFLKT